MSTKDNQLSVFESTIDKKPQYKRTVNQSNLLTTARYSMSAVEMNIVYLLITKLRKDDPVGKIYTLTVKELEEASGKEINYGRLKDYTMRLKKRVYEIEDDKGYIQLGVCASVEYIKQTGVLELEISQKFRPFLFDLKEGFTKYNPRISCSLSSTYAKRFYTLFCMWRSTGVYYTTVRDLKNMFDMINHDKGEEKYPKYGMFKKKVLDIGLREVNEKTDLLVSVKEIKTGRKITNLHFYIKQKDLIEVSETHKVSNEEEKITNCQPIKGIYHKDEPRDGRRTLFTRLTTDYKLSIDQAKRIISNFEYTIITKILYDTQIAISDKKVNHIQNFVWGTFSKRKKI